MERKAINGLHLWQFRNLGAQEEIQHFVTDRISYGPDSEFTLSYSSNPDRAFIDKNRSHVAASLEIGDDKLFFPSQVHETRIVEVTSRTAKNELMDTDALITREKGIAIAVMSADCVPILVYDMENKVVAAIHAGWRGTVAKILSKTLNQMKDEYGTKGQNIIAGIGPSVCQDSYEVGAEVIESVRHSFGTTAHQLLKEQPDGKAKLDLWGANELQLLDFGVNKEKIEISDLCTVKQNANFFSARKGDRGRFAAGIMLKA